MPGITLFGYSKDGGVANMSQLYYPTDVAVDSSGQVYIAETTATT